MGLLIQKKDIEYVNAVDVFKLLFSLCIVGIHTSVLSAFSGDVEWYVMHLVFRLAVPYFFIASAFFYGVKIYRDENNKEHRRSVCRDYIRRNIYYFLFWGGIGLIYYILLMVHGGERTASIVFKTIQTAVFYPKDAMWYLGACFLAVVVITKLWEYNKLIVLISCLGYIWALLCTSYYYLIDNTLLGLIVNKYMDVFISARNGFGVGLIYMYLGIMLAKKDNIIKKMSTTKLILFFSFMYIILMIEVWNCKGETVLDDSSCFIVLPIVALLLFELTMRLKLPIDNKKSIEIRKLSGDIFFLHPAIISYVGVIAFKVIRNYVYRYLFVAIICISIWFLTRKINNKYLRMILP